LSGDVAIAVPVPWQSVGYLIFGGVALGVLFLSFASYSRVETVTGIFTPNTGISNIIPVQDVEK
jgi:membrane fusion protein